MEMFSKVLFEIIKLMVFASSLIRMAKNMKDSGVED